MVGQFIIPGVAAQGQFSVTVNVMVPLVLIRHFLRQMMMAVPVFVTSFLFREPQRVMILLKAVLVFGVTVLLKFTLILINGRQKRGPIKSVIGLPQMILVLFRRSVPREITIRVVFMRRTRWRFRQRVITELTVRSGHVSGGKVKLDVVKNSAPISRRPQTLFSFLNRRR